MNSPDIPKLISEMSLAEKADQMAVVDRKTTLDLMLIQEPNERLDIPPLKQLDGPRGTHLLDDKSKSPCFPVQLAVASTWDRDLAHEVAKDWSKRMRALGIHQLYAPGMNIIMDPRCGRNSEYISEDPLLSGHMAAAFINGIESENIAATVKHYICNNFEAGRFVIDVTVPERVLHEIFLEGWRLMLAHSKPSSVMTCYNSVNGHFVGAHKELTDYLYQWGFDGIIVSDWGANLESVKRAIQAGVSIDMPGFRFYNEEKFQEALDAGEVTLAEIDTHVEKVLRFKEKLGLFDKEPLGHTLADVENNEAAEALIPASRELARKAAAEGTVLLKNEDDLLPLKPDAVQSIALIGPFAESELPLGNHGSSTVYPERFISLAEGLKAVYPNVEIAQGCEVFSYAGAKARHALEFHAEYFDGLDLEGSPVLSRTEDGIRHEKFIGETAARESGYDTSGIVDINLSKNLGDGDNKTVSIVPRIDNVAHMSARWKGTLTAERPGKYYIKIRAKDGLRLFIDGINHVDSWQENWIEGQTHHAWVDLEVGAHDIVIEYRSQRKDGFIQFEYTAPPMEDLFVEARSKASGKDAAIVCVGIDARELQAEACDNDSFNLPGWQDELIQAAYEANPNTIVVLYTAGGVDMSQWIVQVPSVLQAWHPGQEAGHALADVLSGTVNPSAKLTTTFPKSKTQLPQTIVQTEYSSSTCSVGYRRYDAEGQDVQYPFGHGLSYTDFSYSNLEVDGLEVSFELTNTGPVPGKEVAQVYITSTNSPVERPVRELKGFDKVALEPDETKTVSIQLDPHAFSYYCEQTQTWVRDTGQLEIQIGSSSRDIRLSASIQT